LFCRLLIILYERAETHSKASGQAFAQQKASQAERAVPYLPAFMRLSRTMGLVQRCRRESEPAGVVLLISVHMKKARKAVLSNRGRVAQLTFLEVKVSVTLFLPGSDRATILHPLLLAGLGAIPLRAGGVCVVWHTRQNSRTTPCDLRNDTSLDFVLCAKLKVLRLDRNCQRLVTWLRHADRQVRFRPGCVLLRRSATRKVQTRDKASGSGSGSGSGAPHRFGPSAI
jgi:hypothetical protein